MTARIKQAGPPLLAVALTTDVIGYILGGTREQRETNAQAAARSTASPVKANVDRDAYYPGTEDLAPDEMRVVVFPKVEEWLDDDQRAVPVQNTISSKYSSLDTTDLEYEVHPGDNEINIELSSGRGPRQR